MTLFSQITLLDWDQSKRQCKQNKFWLTKYDEQILEGCLSETSIEKEIEESSDWDVRINEIIGKIEEFLKGNYHVSSQDSSRSQSEVGDISHLDRDANLLQFSSSLRIGSSAQGSGAPTSSINTVQEQSLPTATVSHAQSSFNANAQAFQPNNFQGLPPVGVSRGSDTISSDCSFKFKWKHEYFSISY